MFIGVFGAPTAFSFPPGWSVAESMAWKRKPVGAPVSWVIPQVTPGTPGFAARGPLASDASELTLETVATIRPGVPIWSDRLVGEMAAARVGGDGHSTLASVAKSKTPTA